MASLFDHLIGEREQSRRDFEPQSLATIGW
jgi:hypothetical protein